MRFAYDFCQTNLSNNCTNKFLTIANLARCFAFCDIDSHHSIETTLDEKFDSISDCFGGVACPREIVCGS